MKNKIFNAILACVIITACTNNVQTLFFYAVIGIILTIALVVMKTPD